MLLDAGDAAGAAAGAGAGVAAALLSVLGAAVVLLSVLVFLPLKSVAYQPVPLSWKPGAVSCLEKLACWHSGHSVNGASDIFCKTSLANPQALHL